LSSSMDDEQLSEDLAQLRSLLAHRLELEQAYSNAHVKREDARRSYAELVARPAALDPEVHRKRRREVAQSEAALDAASRALVEIKREIDLARLQYDEDDRLRRLPASDDPDK
jgi:hypothetical protein